MGDTGQNPILHNRNPPTDNLTLSCGSNVFTADGLPYLPTGNQHCRFYGEAWHGISIGRIPLQGSGLSFFFIPRDRLNGLSHPLLLHKSLTPLDLIIDSALKIIRLVLSAIFQHSWKL